MEQGHREVMPGPHWYLWAVGVDAGFRRRGIASQLLQTSLARIDTQHVPCYLETASPSTVGMYEKHGFRVAVVRRDDRHSLRLWCMFREAR
jgi:ribosomal protein S18 acetylase RimI-like enzyme